MNKCSKLKKFAWGGQATAPQKSQLNVTPKASNVDRLWIKFAHMATDLAYSINNRKKFGEKKSAYDPALTQAGWQMLAISNDKKSYHQYGYKAVAFVNHQTKRVHIASAGTGLTDIYDLWDNFLLCLGYSLNKLQAVKPFIDELIQQLGEQSSEYQFSTSGHSLGAIVADLTGLELAARGLKICHSTSFENPGSQKVIKYVVANKLLSGLVSDQLLEQFQKICSVFNAKLNIINCSNSQFGKCYLVLNALAEQEKQRVFPALQDEKATGWFKSFQSYLPAWVVATARNIHERLEVSVVSNAFKLGCFGQKLKNNHSLKNFSNIEKSKIIPIKAWSSEAPLIRSYWDIVGVLTTPVKYLCAPHLIEASDILMPSDQLFYLNGSDFLVINSIDAQDGIPSLISIHKGSYEDLQRTGAVATKKLIEESCGYDDRFSGSSVKKEVSNWWHSFSTGVFSLLPYSRFIG